MCTTNSSMSFWFDDDSLLNQSNIINATLSPDAKKEELYNHVYGSVEAKIGFYVGLFIVHFVVGPIMCIGIVLFEMYGGDPMKRNVMNRLVSLILCNIVVLAWLTGIAKVWRDCYGLIDYRWMVWILALKQALVASAMIFYNEATILRFFYVVVWKRIRALDDEFWIRLFAITGYVTVLAFATASAIIHVPEESFIGLIKLSTTDQIIHLLTCLASQYVNPFSPE